MKKYKYLNLIIITLIIILFTPQNVFAVEFTKEKIYENMKAYFSEEKKAECTINGDNDWKYNCTSTSFKSEDTNYTTEITDSYVRVYVPNSNMNYDFYYTITEKNVAFYMESTIDPSQTFDSNSFDSLSKEEQEEISKKISTIINEGSKPFALNSCFLSVTDLAGIDSNSALLFLEKDITEKFLSLSLDGTTMNDSPLGFVLKIYEQPVKFTKLMPELFKNYENDVFHLYSTILTDTEKEFKFKTTLEINLENLNTIPYVPNAKQEEKVENNIQNENQNNNSNIENNSTTINPLVSGKTEDIINNLGNQSTANIQEIPKAGIPIQIIKTLKAILFIASTLLITFVFYQISHNRRKK